MKKLCVIFVFASCVIVGCSVTPTNSASSSSGESAMNIKQEYLSQAAGLNPQTKEYPQQRVEILLQLLDQCGEPKRQTEFERLVGKSEQTDKAFDAILAQAFIGYFLKRQDTASLQKLLSGKCPDYVGGTPLEFVLAASSPKMLLPLPRAFQTASGESRTTILACLARAFPTLRQPGVSDADFARECERWISQSSKSFTLNRCYPYLLALPPPDPNRPLDVSKTGLFVPKGK